MDLVTFKNTQGPIKARYTNDAEAALLTLRAQGTADDSAVTCKVETGRGLALAGVTLPDAGPERFLYTSSSGPLLLLEQRPVDVVHVRPLR